MGGKSKVVLPGRDRDAGRRTESWEICRRTQRWMIQSAAEVGLAMWWDIVPGLVRIEYLGYLPAKDLSFKIINKLLCQYLI